MSKWASRTRGGFAFEIIGTNTDGSMYGWVQVNVSHRSGGDWTLDGHSDLGAAFDLVPINEAAELLERCRAVWGDPPAPTPNAAVIAYLERQAAKGEE